MSARFKGVLLVVVACLFEFCESSLVMRISEMGSNFYNSPERSETPSQAAKCRMSHTTHPPYTGG